MNDLVSYYDFRNAINSSYSPSSVHIKNTGLRNFFTNYLLLQTFARYKFTIPATWSKTYFLYNLFCNGYVGVFNTDKFGLVCQFGALTGFDFYYQPAELIIVNNKLINSINAKLHVNAELIQLLPNYHGIMDIVGFYADLMALCAEACGMNLINSKLSYVFAADNKNTAESFKRLYDDVAGGAPAVVADKKLFDDEGHLKMEYFAQNLMQNFIAPQLIECLRKVENMFNTKMGFPNANTEKKERMLVDEVNANNVETMALCNTILESIEESMERVRKMFGLSKAELNVELRTMKGDDAVDQDYEGR